MSVSQDALPAAVADLDSLTTDELFELSDRTFRQGEHGASRAALTRAVELGDKLHIAYHKLARLDFAANELQQSVRHLALGAAADESFAFNWLWLAKAHAMLEAPDVAAGHALRFVAFGLPPYNANDIALLETLAAHLFTAGQRARSLALYDYLAQLSPTKTLLRVRLAEALSASGEHTRALEMLEALDREGALDLWGRRALAEARSHNGDRAGAIALMGQLFSETDGDPAFLDFYAHLLRHAPPAVLSRALETHGTRFPTALRDEIRTRLDVAEGRIDEASELLLAQQGAPPKHLYHLAFEVAYAALGRARTAVAAALCERLRQAGPEDIHVRLLHVNILFAEQDWENAGEILDALPPEEAQLPHVLLKRFEYACFVRDTATAARLLRQIEDVPAPSKDFHLPIFRFLAEQGAWDEIVDRAALWLDRGFRYEAIGSVLFRAAKKTARHRDLIDAVEMIIDWGESPDLRRLRSALALDAAHNGAELDRLAADPLLTTHAGVRRRLEIQRTVWARASGRERRRALFLCTNRPYLCASLVALHSALAFTNTTETDYFVVVDDDLQDTAERYLAPYADAGLSMRAIPAQRILEGNERLDAGYGLFTSGHTLSESAYYRIFFARHLLAEGGHDRALYIDSDVLVRAPLAPLYEAGLDELPLSARVETMRPEVRRAIRTNAIKDDNYFNSGVLLFDLVNPTVARGLERTVHAIADEDTTLLFQDQCALNVGFNGNFRRWTGAGTSR